MSRQQLQSELEQATRQPPVPSIDPVADPLAAGWSRLAQSLPAKSRVNEFELFARVQSQVRAAQWRRVTRWSATAAACLLALLGTAGFLWYSPAPQVADVLPVPRPAGDTQIVQPNPSQPRTLQPEEIVRARELPPSREPGALDEIPVPAYQMTEDDSPAEQFASAGWDDGLDTDLTELRHTLARIDSDWRNPDFDLFGGLRQRLHEFQLSMQQDVL